jgi:hypothetical protein
LSHVAGDERLVPGHAVPARLRLSRGRRRRSRTCQEAAGGDQRHHPPGAIIVDLQWDNSVDADVDLWVEAPGDVPVGYSNKAGMIFNLLRDDLGHSGDPNSMNYEVAYGRGRWAGEYTVNAHLYRSADHRFPIKVKARVQMQTPEGLVRNLTQSTIDLTYIGQESTVFRFRLDDRGELVDGSLNRLHKELRSARYRGGDKTS